MSKDKPVWKLNDEELMQEIQNVEAALKGLEDGTVVLEGSIITKESLQERLKELQAAFEHRINKVE